MLRPIMNAVSQVFEGVLGAVGVRAGTEEPDYTIEGRVGDAVIRRYAPRIAAQTTVASDEEAARSEGFRRLARFIFGANHSQTKIAMTAPVAQQPVAANGKKIAMTTPVAQQRNDAGSWIIQFFMPAEYNLDTLPAPDDDSVELVSVPAERVAVLKFSGARDGAAVAAHTAKLVTILENSHYQVAGDPVAWFYDPPWTLPPLRRNEIGIPVATGHSQPVV